MSAQQTYTVLSTGFMYSISFCIGSEKMKREEEGIARERLTSITKDYSKYPASCLHVPNHPALSKQALNPPNSLPPSVLPHFRHLLYTACYAIYYNGLHIHPHANRWWYVCTKEREQQEETRVMNEKGWRKRRKWKRKKKSGGKGRSGRRDRGKKNRVERGL